MSGDSLENFLDSATRRGRKNQSLRLCEDGVGGVGVADEFEFGIVEDHVAIILDAEGAAYLKDDFCFVGIGFHDGS